MVDASSRDLHPRHGARFVLVREGESDRWGVEVWLPGDGRARGHLTVTADATEIRFVDAGPGAPPAWVHDEVRKLARVLRRSPKQRLTRWRPGPE